MRRDVEDIEREIGPIVHDELGGLDVQSVQVREEVAHDGDNYLRVVIVFERGKPDGAKVLSLRRHMRDKLGEIGEDRFPLTTFMTRKEAEDAGAAI